MFGSLAWRFRAPCQAATRLGVSRILVDPFDKLGPLGRLDAWANFWANFPLA